MTIELTEEQSRVLAEAGVISANVIDPRTKKNYVLLSADAFERLNAIASGPDYDLSDTYRAQFDSAMRAGWDDPRMDEYNDYDAHRKT